PRAPAPLGAAAGGLSGADDVPGGGERRHPEGVGLAGRGPRRRRGGRSRELLDRRAARGRRDRGRRRRDLLRDAEKEEGLTPMPIATRSTLPDFRVFTDPEP